MSKITTHVLDTVLGKPGAGIAVALEQKQNGLWNPVGASKTDADGRCRELGDDLPAGKYRLTFNVGPYFAQMNRKSIYSEVQVTFDCGGEPHYHLPLLLSDNSYTTYRGS